MKEILSINKDEFYTGYSILSDNFKYLMFQTKIVAFRGNHLMVILILTLGSNLKVSIKIFN